MRALPKVGGVGIEERFFRKVKVMRKMVAAVKKLFTRSEGATMIEYGLMLALIAAVCLAAVTLLGTNAQALFNTLAGAL